MGLFESLEEDMKAAKLNSDGEPDDDLDDEGADGAAQGGEGKPEGSGEGKPAEGDGGQKKDGTAPVVAAPAGSEGDTGKPLSPAEEAYNRRIIREKETRIKELEAQIANSAKPAPIVAPEPVKPAAATKKETPDEWRARNTEPDREKDLAAWLVWNAEDQRHWREEQTASTAHSQEQQRVSSLIEAGKQEIETLQADYRKINPDYDNALNHAKAEYSRAIKTLMPQMTEVQIKQAIDKEIFNMALKCHRDGTNLGEVLYDTAIERFGYEGTVAESKTPAANRPNLRVVANNKKKSASPLEGGGQGAKPRVSLEEAANMSPAELMELDAGDWESLQSHGF